MQTTKATKIYGFSSVDLCQHQSACKFKHKCYYHHPKWLVSENLCVYNLRGECTRKNKHQKHIDWDDLPHASYVTEESSVDYFTNSNDYLNPTTQQPQETSISFELRNPVCFALLGGTGQGKTTLLTAIKDFVEQKTFQNKTQVKIENAKSLAESQTKSVTQEIFTKDNNQAKVMDTPGIGDTQGIEEDEKHLKAIADKIANKGEFNAICFVMHNSNARCTPELKYIITELKGLLPISARNNFIICVTSCRLGFMSKHLLEVLKKLGFPDDVPKITFDNEAYDLKADTLTPKQMKVLEESYQENQQQIKKLIEEAANLKPYVSMGIEEIRIKRNELKQLIGQYSTLIANSNNRAVDLKNYQQQIDIYEQQMKVNKDYTFESKPIKVLKPIKMPGGKIHTACMTCKKICHNGCGLPYKSELSQCYCINGENCKFCTCHWKFHEHQDFENTEVEEPGVVTTNADMKKLYDDGQKWKKHYEELKQKIEGEEKQIENCWKKIVELYEELSSLAIVGFNESFEDYLNQLEKMIGKDPKLEANKKKAQLEDIAKRRKIFKEVQQMLKK